jgi:hypothetical protein
MQSQSTRRTITMDVVPQEISGSRIVPKQPIVYALQFHGEVKRTGIDGSVFETTTRSSGCTIDTRIDGNGLLGAITTTMGDNAVLESELVLTGATTFQQTGRIVLGSGSHGFTFTTIGSGHFESASAGEGRHGAAIWRIERGEGQFAGATGLIASNFVVSTSGDVIDHHLGVIYLPAAVGQPVESTRNGEE